MKTILNKKAYHDYTILETIEAGIEFVGCEVKSVQAGKANIKGSFCKFFKHELFAMDFHISKYDHDNSWSQHDEKRAKKLLLKKKELIKLKAKVEEDGLTIVPLKVYFNDRHKAKIEIGLAKGKKLFDKREDNKQKTIKRAIEQEYKQKIK